MIAQLNLELWDPNPPFWLSVEAWKPGSASWPEAPVGVHHPEGGHWIRKDPPLPMYYMFSFPALNTIYCFCYFLLF